MNNNTGQIPKQFRVSGAAVGLALGLAFLAAALAESFGLAMIIGAFSIGLALSGTDLAHRLEAPLQGVYATLVPIFFVVMGMMVDVTALGGVWVFGVLLTLMATIGKLA
ncbi:cation:proton antiporter, partial [Patescibacteria group bacterium]|nr:cation:proton antiporter [Patescibacteria group bacterium]